MKHLRQSVATQTIECKGKHKVTESGLVKTGVEGLDAVLLGGIPKTNVIMVQGAAGTGKTLLGTGVRLPRHNALQRTRNDRGVRKQSRPVVARWRPVWLESCGIAGRAFGSSSIVFTSPQVLELELRSPDSLLLETATAIGAQRIFIDGIGLRASHPQNNAVP